MQTLLAKNFQFLLEFAGHEKSYSQSNTKVVINNLIPFGRPNLRGLLSYKNKQSYYNSVQPVEKPAMVSTAQEKSENLAKSKVT